MLLVVLASANQPRTDLQDQEGASQRLVEEVVVVVVVSEAVPPSSAGRQSMRGNHDWLQPVRKFECDHWG